MTMQISNSQPFSVHQGGLICNNLISVCGLMGIYFIPRVIWYFIYFVAQVVPALAIRSSSDLAPDFQQASVSYSIFLLPQDVPGSSCMPFHFL